MKKNDVSARKVVWQLKNDGLKPTDAPYGFVARNPLARSIPPGGKITFSLNVQANLPMLAFPVRPHVDDLTVDQIVQQGQDIVVTIENKSKHAPLMVEDKEGLVSLYPLLFDGVGEVG